MIYVAHDDTITYEKIQTDKLQQKFTGFHIFFIADVHRRTISEKTLLKVNKPIDIVLIGGDLIERHVSFNKLRENIIKLKRWNKPIYFVWGNNDLETDTEKLIEILTLERVTILKDSSIEIIKDNEKINLIGFDYYEDNTEPLIDWKEIDHSFTIVLTHKPSQFYELKESEKNKVDLVLAGHTHGGQIRIFGLGIYRRGGLETDKQTKVFVTEGYGYTLLPFRLQTKAECHVVSITYDGE